jgi:sensor histidine kinase YesM
MVGLVVAVLVLCMIVRVSFFYFISFYFISFIVLEIGGDYLKKRCEQSLSIDSAAAFSAVLPENGAYYIEAIFHGPQFSLL